MTDTHYTDALMFCTNTPAQAESILHALASARMQIKQSS